MKLKMNWGTGILLFILAFMAVFTSLLIRSFGDEYDHELVTENYYEKELIYQDQYDKAERLKKTGQRIGVNQTDDAILLDFSKFKQSTGTVFFYRPSQESMDRTMQIAVDSNHVMSVPRSELSSGNYDLQIDFESEGVTYFQSTPITVR